MIRCLKMFPNIVVLVSVLATYVVAELDDACVSTVTVKNNAGRPKVIKVRGTGNLYSPGFERNEPYPENVRCSYQLQAPVGMHIRLKFNYFDVDPQDSCEADAVAIHDFEMSGKGILKSLLCGNTLPRDYVSETHAIQVVLSTDAFLNRRGFNITYSLQDNAALCGRGQRQCRNRNCVDLLAKCDGKDDCGDGTDEENCYKPLIEAECGKPDVEPLLSEGDRIVGGQEALQGSWPWMADLNMNIAEPSGHVCGGTLINSQWVLTAAHCFEELRKPSDWRIHLGNHHKFEKDEYEQVRYAERIIIYDDIPAAIFQRNGEYDIENDMALIKLNAPVKFTKFVKPACLPELYIKLNLFSNCYATGWGATRGTGSSDVLKQAYHPVQNDMLCRRLVGNQFKPRTMICAGSMAPLNGVCHGDSGGPLVCESEENTNEWSIVGVASFVTDSNSLSGLCGLKGRPSVFNRVSLKVSWIQKMIYKYT